MSLAPELSPTQPFAAGAPAGLQRAWLAWDQLWGGFGFLGLAVLGLGLALLVFMVVAQLRRRELNWRQRLLPPLLWLAVGAGGMALTLTISPGFGLLLLAFLVPLTQNYLRAKKLARLLAQQQPQRSGRSSLFASTQLTLQLDHDSNRLQGTVIAGPLTGMGLHELDRHDLIALYDYLRTTDEPAWHLLILWLDRHGPPLWRREFGVAPPGAAPAAGHITPDEAIKILGIGAGATHAHIQEAYKNLMQRNHPDVGGSHYVAQLLNRARDVLLKEDALPRE